MKPVWNLTPTPGGLLISLADQMMPHLDRAGVCYHLEAAPGVLARFAAGAVCQAQGLEFVPETRGELLEKAEKLGLLTAEDRDKPLTREEAALWMVRLIEKWEELR